MSRLLRRGAIQGGITPGFPASYNQLTGATGNTLDFSGDFALSDMQDMAFHPDVGLLVLDKTNDLVWQYDGLSNTQIGQLVDFGADPDLSAVSGIAVSSSFIAISNRTSPFTIKFYNLDGSPTGDSIEASESLGNSVYGICFDKTANTIWVASSGTSDSVDEYELDGTYTGRSVIPGNSEIGFPAAPAKLFADINGLYIYDVNNDNIELWSRENVYQGFRFTPGSDLRFNSCLFQGFDGTIWIGAQFNLSRTIIEYGA